MRMATKIDQSESSAHPPEDRNIFMNILLHIPTFSLNERGDQIVYITHIKASRRKSWRAPPPYRWNNMDLYYVSYGKNVADFSPWSIIIKCPNSSTQTQQSCQSQPSPSEEQKRLSIPSKIFSQNIPPPMIGILVTMMTANPKGSMLKKSTVPLLPYPLTNF